MALLDYAKTQFQILKQTTTEAIIEDFEPEILAIIQKFESQGHSGSSASYAIPIITTAIKKLLSFEPINPVTEEGFELIDENNYQHKYLPALFMKKNDQKPYYLDAVIFQEDEDEGIAFTSSGTVYVEEIKDNKIPEIIGSRQYVKFPFYPKKFYITVKKIYGEQQYFEQNNIIYGYDQEKQKHYYHVLKNKEELIPVFQYYIKP